MNLNCKSMLQKLEHYCTTLENEMHIKETFFYQRIEKEGDIIKVFVTDLKLKSNKGMRRGKERGKETA